MDVPLVDASGVTSVTRCVAIERRSEVYNRDFMHDV